MLLKEIVHGLQGARQILFVAIQVGQNFAGGSAPAAVHRVIHAGIFFDETFDVFLEGQPILCAIVRL